MKDDGGGPGSERRRYPRFNVKLPVEFTIAGENRRCRATVDDISLAGVLLLTDEPLEQGTLIVVHLPSPPERPLDIQAAVVRTSVVGELGVAFIELTESQLEQVSNFVERRSPF